MTFRLAYDALTVRHSNRADLEHVHPLQLAARTSEYAVKSVGQSIHVYTLILFLWTKRIGKSGCSIAFILAQALLNFSLCYILDLEVRIMLRSI